MRPFVEVFSRRVSNASNLCIWALATIIMAISGPFGSYEAHPFIERLILWGLIVGWALIVAAFVMTWAPKADRLKSEIQREVACSFLFAIIFTPTLWIGLAIYTQGISSVPSPISLLFTNVLIAMVVGFVRSALMRDISSGFLSENAQKPESFRPRLMDRLPNGAKGPILRISARNHLVTVVTELESYELRLRLSDAVAEMEGVEGYLTHRSHWVAKDAIVALERENGKAFVISQDEEKVPVSRKNLPLVQQAVSA